MKEFQNKNEWAIILGGSSGLGLATAKKLAKHGLHICVVHRNSRSQLEEIQSHFEEIRNKKVNCISYNIDAINPDKRKQAIEKIQQELGES